MFNTAVWRHTYLCGDNTAVGGITLCVKLSHYSRGHNSLCGGISYNSVCGHIPVQKEKYYIIRIKK